MASKRAIRRRACQGKRRYENHGSARVALAHHSKGKGFDGMHVYHCDFCGGWHLGHPPRFQQLRHG